RGRCSPPPYTPQARSGAQDRPATSEISMTTSRSPDRLDPRRRHLGMLAMALAVAATLLVGCGDKKKEKAATQTAAKVNKEEITVHTINFLLAQQRALAPEQAASASRAALERLIDQELALQKAD